MLTGKTLYIDLKSMEQSLQTAEQGLAALDRNLSLLRLRQTLGQASAQAVADMERTRADTASQIESLRHTITTATMQLQLLIGETPTGELSLDDLPNLPEVMTASLDYAADLAAAKKASWVLRSAEITLQDAKDDWKDNRYTGTYTQEVALHTWNAAQITYQSAVQDFETSFQTLFRSLTELGQVWQNKQDEVSNQERQYAVAQAQYDWGASPVRRF